MTAVAVVVCSRDRPALLGGAVEAVLGSLRPGDEAIVVDSASREASACRPAELAGVRVVRVTRPGLSVARNAGIEATSAPIVAFTDDDCRPRPDWAAAIDAAFSEPATGFVTGPAVADRETSLPVSVIPPGAPRRFSSGDDPFRCGTGANMAVARRALDAVGYFDESLGAGAPFRSGEDIDMFRRLLRAGWEGRFDPNPVVIHHQWRTTRQAIKLGYGYGLGGGALAAKSIREDGPEGWRMLARRLGRDGVARLGADAVRRYRSGAAMDALLLVGTVAGALRGARRYGTSGPRAMRQDEPADGIPPPA